MKDGHTFLLHWTLCCNPVLRPLCARKEEVRLSCVKALSLQKEMLFILWTQKFRRYGVDGQMISIYLYLFFTYCVDYFSMSLNVIKRVTADVWNVNNNETNMICRLVILSENFTLPSLTDSITSQQPIFKMIYEEDAKQLTVALSLFL